MPKWIIVLVIAALIFMVGYVAHYGRQRKRTGCPLALAHHRGGTNCVLWLTLLAIACIEFMVNGILHHPYPTIFYVHLPLAITFAGTFLAMRFLGLTGERYPAVHRPLAYSCLGTFAGALGTGTVLLWQV